MKRRFAPACALSLRVLPSHLKGQRRDNGRRFQANDSSAAAAAPGAGRQGRPLPVRRGRRPLVGEGAADFADDVVQVLVEHEVPGIKPHQLGLGQVAEVAFRAGRNEEGVLVTP